MKIKYLLAIILITAINLTAKEDLISERMKKQCVHMVYEVGENNQEIGGYLTGILRSAQKKDTELKVFYNASIEAIGVCKDALSEKNTDSFSVRYMRIVKLLIQQRGL